MAAIDLPRECTHLSLLTAMQEAHVFNQEWERLVFRVPPQCFVSSSAMALLGAWGQLCCNQGKQLKFMGNDDILRYLSRMDLFNYIDFEYQETFQRHHEVGRFIPLKLIEDEESVKLSSKAICDLILRNFENGRELLPAI